MTKAERKDKQIDNNPYNKKAPVRLWVRSKFLGFRRNRLNQRPSHALLKIEGVNKVEDTQYYLGKRVVYIYKAPTTA